MATPTQVRTIKIKVDAPGVKDALESIGRSMGSINKNTKSLAGNMGFLTNAFRSWLGFLGVRELARMSDEMLNISNRLKIFTGSTEGARAALGQVAAVADRTNQSVREVGEVYSRLAISLDGSKATTAEITSLTETLINTFRVAGATTTETTNTIIQLSQAFASGQLRGQELRSVMEQNAALAGLLRERFGQDIYKKAEAGAISVTEVLKVLSENVGKITKDANELAPTFEQTLAKGMNKVSLAISDVSQKYELHAKFAAIVGFASDNLVGILTILGGVITVLGITKIPAMIASLNKLRVALFALAVNSPLVAFTALATVGTLIYQNWDKVTATFKKARAAFLEYSADYAEKTLKMKEEQARISGSKSLLMEVEQIRKSITVMRGQAASVRESLVPYGPETPVKDPVAEMQKNLDALIGKMKEGAVKAKTLKEELAELNRAYLSGVISISEYNKKLIDFQVYKVNKEFKDGKTDIFKYHEALADLDLQEFNRQFATGVFNLQQFQAMVAFNKMGVLKEQLDAGRISLAQYNAELTKLDDKVRVGSAFYTGVSSYIESVGSLSSNIAKGIEQAFSHLEDNLTEFIKTGTFNFKKFTQSILDDLTRIIVRASIVQPLAQGLLGLSSPSATGIQATGGMGTMEAAKGAAFSGGNVIPFARGGIVDSPTAFSFGGGRKRGLMGEAGTEAIIPLQRAGNGDLGVAASLTPVTINIVNQSGSDIQQTEKTGPNGERQIDILITSKVREGIATGKYDTAMRSAYGISRKGS